jgi:hypothetical protein
VFPLESLVNPFYPLDVPHDFLIFQKPSEAPTKTPWLTVVPQFDKNPLLYTEASTATATGMAERASIKFSHPGTSVKPVILLFP